MFVMFVLRNDFCQSHSKRIFLRKGVLCTQYNCHSMSKEAVKPPPPGDHERAHRHKIVYTAVDGKPEFTRKFLKEIGRGERI